MPLCGSGGPQRHILGHVDRILLRLSAHLSRSAKKIEKQRIAVTNLDFLAGLPTVLGIGGYVAYYVGRLRERSSPILKSIVEIIKQKGVSLPELDQRLTAKQVFMLVQNSPELRRKLEKRDYELLESVMRRDERSHLFAIVGLLISLLTSFGAYAYIQTTKPKIISASLKSLLSGPPNTFDDIELQWSHSGNNEPYLVRVTSAEFPEVSISKQVMAADHRVRLNASELENFWPHPKLDQSWQLRVEFLNDTSNSTFGPFDVVTALEILYFIDDKVITVASMDGQNALMHHSFEVKCVAWPRRAINGITVPESVTLTTSAGKATTSFNTTESLDPNSLKCVYLGSAPQELVRYTNLNTKY